MQFSVSVIIPVYNDERFIEKAINSAIQQPEVSEIVVVNDGSTDKTEHILENLQKQNSKIKVYYHEGKLNKGRSASRNLGIKKAIGNYIAFLDADDFYLPNRFTNDKKIFNERKSIEGVYNAISAHFYREGSKAEKEQLSLTTIKKRIAAEVLFEALLLGSEGHFSIDGLTLKKSAFNKVGYFNQTMLVSEDTELIFKLSLKCKLQSGIIDKPVAMRGVHGSNVFNREDLYAEHRIKMYQSLLFWANKNQVALHRIDKLLNTLWVLKYKQKKSLISYIGYWGHLFFNAPRSIFSMLGIKYFPIIRLRQKLFPFLYKHS
ncbi:glycosyltransferase family 2 protein [Flavivirga rizhaonensis]|uniref:Glycosyltransferase family 2 protein n=1 Tax=Flavivirga rizhaonensis TaxID=2559571 RepID=A0A4S1E1F9_9FLAO|nr:glycosyltransferase family 2 protein [Flavivirga rizhaonensis]TGV04417.1 glycosyltransferase family 2 protein [Flavivirga rizhaonensis]